MEKKKVSLVSLEYGFVTGTSTVSIYRSTPVNVTAVVPSNSHERGSKQCLDLGKPQHVLPQLFALCLSHDDQPSRDYGFFVFRPPPVFVQSLRTQQRQTLFIRRDLGFFSLIGGRLRIGSHRRGRGRECVSARFKRSGCLPFGTARTTAP